MMRMRMVTAGSGSCSECFGGGLSIVTLFSVLIDAAIVMVGAGIETAKQEGINSTVALEERQRPRKERPVTRGEMVPVRTGSGE